MGLNFNNPNLHQAVPSPKLLAPEPCRPEQLGSPWNGWLGLFKRGQIIPFCSDFLWMFCFCGRLEIWGPPSNGRISCSNGRRIDYMIWPSWTWPIRQWRKGVCGITMKRPGRPFQKWGQFETSQTDVMQTQIGGPHIGSPRSRATKRNSLDHSKFGTRHLETPYNLRPAY